MPLNSSIWGIRQNGNQVPFIRIHKEQISKFLKTVCKKIKIGAYARKSYFPCKQLELSKLVFVISSDFFTTKAKGHEPDWQQPGGNTSHFYNRTIRF